MHIKPLTPAATPSVTPPAGKPAPAASGGDFSQLLKTAQTSGTPPTPAAGS